ncbi:YDG domain-containing protein [Inhella gelatinilytica]|uniref:Filamentous hemagglutinin N-terminal domain-containing protein n=1 Tax=Inhella gelatinilytica TaxID=2795030 RepID=A0A931IY64_9BURK|nr:YDG domain-containing protein [Inhella gelatinilytica]MBH9554067.1 filamentous hemagglutinin N-terminal domain-containing protein [Inhella gelatinilytica]
MKSNAQRLCRPGFLLRPLAQALVASAVISLPVSQAQTLPSGLKVVQGSAVVSQQGSSMTVTNTPNAILNWDRFSISAGAKVHFQQQSASSKVLNRVVGRDPSYILGDLTSNGQVWLQNPSGILFGANARVDVAGLVATTLSVADADFTAGRLRLGGDNTLAAGGIVNQGLLHSAHGGQVALVATEVRNEGHIQTPGGQAVLAAGRQVELFDSSTPNIRIRVPLAAGEVFNSGLIEAGEGRIDIAAAAVRQLGELKADGAQGGTVTVDAAGGTLLQEGRISAQGTEGLGGQVRLLGKEVGLLGTSVVDASGATGGGEILVGGGLQGQDARWTNARAVFFGADAQLRADATRLGDGGRVILWSDNATRAYGSLSAQGGAQGGNGGFIETSGGWLDARPRAINTLAVKGQAGQWLLDPFSIEIVTRTGPDINVVGSAGLFSPSSSPSQITTDTIASALVAGQNVTITTAPGTGDGDIFWRGANLSVNALNSAVTLNLIADRNVQFDTGSSISSDSTLHVSLQAGRGGQGGIQLNSRTTINTQGDITLGGSLSGAAPGSGDGFPSIWIDNADLTSGGALKMKGHNGFGSHGVDLQGGTYEGQSIEIQGKALSGKGVYVHGATLNARTGLTLRGEGTLFGVYADNSFFSLNEPGSYASTAALTIDGKATGGSGMGVQLSSSGGTSLEATRVGEVRIQGWTDATNQPAIQINGTDGSFNINNLSVARLRIEADSGGIEFNQVNIAHDNQAPDTRSVVIRASDVIWNWSQLLGGDDIRLMANSHQFLGSSTQIGGNSLVAFDGIFSLMSISASSSGPTAQAAVMGFNGGGAERIDNQVGSGLFGSAITQWTLIGVDPRDSAVYTSGQRQFNPNGLTHAYRRYGAGTYSPAAVSGFGNGFWFSQSMDAVVSGSVANKVYDSTTAASASGVTVTGLSGDTLSFTGSSASFVNKQAGAARAATIQISGLTAVDAGGQPVYGYNVVPASVTATITPASLSVAGLSALNKVYDAGVSASLSGTPTVIALGSDVVSVASGYSGQFSDKNVGTNKAVTVSGLSLTGTDAGNYTLIAPSGLQASITKAPLLVTGLSAQNRVYDTTATAQLVGTAAVSPLGSDVVGLVGTAAGAFSNKNVGSSKTVAISGLSLTGADAGNYALSVPSLTASITPAPLPIGGLTAQSKVYDASASATLVGTPVVSPLGSDAVGLVGTAAGAFSNKNVGSSKTVAISGLSLTGADAGNYALSAPSLTASITPAPLPIGGLTAQSKVYDASVSAPLVGTPTFTTLGSDSVTVSGQAGQFADKNVGTNKPVTVTGLTLGGADAANYTAIVPTSLQASITPAPLVVGGLIVQNKTYDATRVAQLVGTATVSPLGADTVAVVTGYSALFDDKNVGVNKAVSVQGLSLTGADAANYTVVAPTHLQASVMPAPLVVTGLTGQSKVYDTTLSASVSGAAQVTPLGSDDVGLLGTVSAQFATRQAGTSKPISLSGLSLTGPDAGNYTLTMPSLTGNISPAPLLVTGLVAADRVYNSTTVAGVTGSPVVAPLGSDSVIVTGTATGNFGDKNAGVSKGVTVSGLGLSGVDGGNYTLVLPSLSASITPAPLVITGLVALDKVYDATTAAPLSGTPGFSPLANDNVTLTGGLTGQFADKNVGTNKSVTLVGLSLSGPDAGNYVPVASGALQASITTASLVVTGLVAQSKVYDGTTGAQLSGNAQVNPLGNDEVSLCGCAVAQFSDKNVGTGKAVTVSGLNLTGADAGNYTVLSPTGLQANITPAALTVTGLTAQDKVYDATTVATVTGSAAVSPLGGDTVSVVGSASGVLGHGQFYGAGQ